jgi:hypothetical protein
LLSPGSAARVSARLSQETLVLGDSIDLTLSITDGGKTSVPREIQVPGLTIQFSGQAQKTQIINRQISSSQELTYTVEARQPGTFTIPPIEVRSDGQVLRTQPISLTVQAADASSERKREELVFAEITLSNSTGYVGEMIPAELRLFVDARVHWQAEQMPSFSGEGFTKQKMPEPTRERAQRDGRDYDVIKFSTAITPSRAGKLMIGPGEISIQAQLPQERKNRQRSPLDSFFGDSFDPFFSTQPIKRITVKAAAVQLEVKPLPTEGRPKDFSGAVGSFRLSAEGSPKKVKIGDPLTMKLIVSGKSNFDRVNPPALRDSKGWRAYPPSVEFRPDDELASSGTKPFELALIPESGHRHMPVFDFSYFDPRLGKYVTLSSDAFPLEVTGTPPQEPVTPSSNPPTPPEASPRPSEQDDLLGLLHEPGVPRAWPRIPISPKPWVLIALILSGVFVAAVAVSIGRPRDAIFTAKKQLRREMKQLFSQIQTPDLPNAPFLESASRILQIAESLQSGQPPQTVNVAEVLGRRPLDAATHEILEKLVRSRTDLLYAGKGDWEPRFSSEERTQVIRALKTFAERHARPTAL